MFTEFSVKTEARQDLYEITHRVREIVRTSGIPEGVCVISIPHTTAGVILNENWDDTVRQDLVRALDAIVPPALGYRHAEGNSPAHIKALLIGSSECVIIHNGRLLLGNWQGIYLAEFDGPRLRRVCIKIIAG